MHFERYGHGQRTFLALHGWGSDHHTFAPVAAGIPDDVSLFAPDLPGQGQSEPPASWTLESIQAELEALIEDLPRPLTLIGNCSGALLALSLARRRASSFSRLVLVDAFAWCPWYFQLFLMPGFGRQAYLTTFANPIGRWITNGLLAARRSDSTHLTRGFSKTDHEHTYQYLRLLGSLKNIEQFKDLKMPVDILYGERTFSAIRLSADKWQDLWPGSRVFRLYGAGHMPLQEATSQMRMILFQTDTPQEALCPARPICVPDLRGLIEAGMEALLPVCELRSARRLNDAMRYAVFPGGKRLRPNFALLAAGVAGHSYEDALSSACAVEFLHTSSLIFDDLPCMDDADLRRGRTALHLKFGEDVATLAALALLNQAYAIFGRCGSLIEQATGCIGVNGMIGGQALDLELHAVPGSRPRFASRNRKTTSLLRLTFTAGAIACGSPLSDIHALAKCGECLGDAYQIYDDLLDEFSDSVETGKTAHQDSRHGRSNYISEFGTGRGHEDVSILITQAKSAILERFAPGPSVIAIFAAIDALLSKRAALGLVSA